MRETTLPLPWRAALLLPALTVFVAFWLIPAAVLVRISADGHFLKTYGAILGNSRYLTSLWQTVALSAVVTAATIVLSVISGLFLANNHFPGKRLLVSLLTLPLAFPGVVVGFMVIMLAGRQGVIGSLSMAALGDRWVFAYSMGGLFLGYLYFSIPKIVISVMAAVRAIDPSTVEAARSLGAGPWAVMRDVVLPALRPTLIASGAICFAISIGAFGTAFTLATDINVLPMVIYTEFTLNANLVTAAALSVILGVVTWAVLLLARSVAGTVAVGAGG